MIRNGKGRVASNVFVSSMSGPVSANQMTGPQGVSICARDLECSRLQHETATHASEKEN